MHFAWCSVHASNGAACVLLSMGIQLCTTTSVPWPSCRRNLAISRPFSFTYLYTVNGSNKQGETDWMTDWLGWSTTSMMTTSTSAVVVMQCTAAASTDSCTLKTGRSNGTNRHEQTTRTIVVKDSDGGDDDMMMVMVTTGDFKLFYMVVCRYNLRIV